LYFSLSARSHSQYFVGIGNGDLDALTETEVEQGGRRFMLRSAPRPAASLALRAAGVALPPSVQSIASD
jgi:hypothetical protein